MDDRWVFTAVIWGLHEVVFFFFWGMFGLLHRRGVATRFLVVGGKAPKPEVHRRAALELIPGHLALLPATAFLFYPAWVAMGGTMDGPSPSLFEVSWQILACILLQDTMFYWSHRWLHSPRLFRAFHRKHHDFRYVRGLAAEYGHPVELTLNVASFILPAILLGTHVFTFALWVGIRVYETVEAHSGYAFTPYASRHAYHHLYAARGCLGSFFGLWDRLMGTDRHWREWRKSQPHP